MDNLQKKTVKELQKRLKPVECLKYVRMLFDSSVMSVSYGQILIKELNSMKIKNDFEYDFCNLPVKETIIWERNIEQLTSTPSVLCDIYKQWQREDFVARILSHSELQHMLKNDCLHQFVHEMKTLYPNKRLIVLYLSLKEKSTERENQALVELQFSYQLQVLKLTSNIKDLVHELKRLTKAIAEKPYKEQKSATLDSFRKYLANDNKHCVRVEGNNGFDRLWQQHLNRLPMVTLEVAKSIINQYPCPKILIDALENNSESVGLIANMKVKRNGPKILQTNRRIGVVLAQKLYMLYNSNNPNLLL